MKERSLRHGDNEDLDKLYSSDISTVKKMLMAESNKGKLKHHKVDTGSPNKDENFANRDTKRKNKKKPTASEQRNMQKLFRRKQAREAAEMGSQTMLNQASSTLMFKDNSGDMPSPRDVTDIQKELKKRQAEHENRSSRFARIANIKQKLPFLNQNNTN